MELHSAKVPIYSIPRQRCFFLLSDTMRLQRMMAELMEPTSRAIIQFLDMSKFGSMWDLPRSINLQYNIRRNLRVDESSSALVWSPTFVISNSDRWMSRERRVNWSNPQYQQKTEEFEIRLRFRPNETFNEAVGLITCLYLACIRTNGEWLDISIIYYPSRVSEQWNSGILGNNCAYDLNAWLRVVKRTWIFRYRFNSSE